MRRDSDKTSYDAKMVKYLPESGYKRIAVIAFYAVLGVICFILLVRCLFDVFLPFVIAWGVSMLIRPVIMRMEKRLPIPKKLLSVLIVTAFFLLVGGILFWICHRLVYEIGNAIQSLTQNYDTIASGITDIAGWISDKLPSRDGSAVVDVDAVIATGLDMLKSTLTAVSAKLPGIAASLVTALPGVILFAVILITSSYYISVDIDGINKRLVARLPETGRRIVHRAAQCVKSAGFSYLRAYAFIMFVTFAELLTGFLIIRVRYAVIAAIIIAIADMLPVIGVGAILTPWAAVLILRGDTYRGIGLLLILAVIQLVRQVIEPRIVGVSIGLSQLGTLVSMYAGFRLAGIIGMLAAPVLLLLAKNLFSDNAGREAAQSRQPRKSSENVGGKPGSG